jgi:hypothetical protein
MIKRKKYERITLHTQEFAKWVLLNPTQIDAQFDLSLFLTVPKDLMIGERHLSCRIACEDDGRAVEHAFASVSLPIMSGK